MRLPASRSACFTQWKSTERSARTHAPALRAGVQIEPDRPSVAGTPADKQFGNGASDTSKIKLQGCPPNRGNSNSTYRSLPSAAEPPPPPPPPLPPTAVPWVPWRGWLALGWRSLRVVQPK